MKLSIIIPCYKRANQTKKTLKLLLGSKGWGKEFQAEIIVVDSTPDDSLKKALVSFGNQIKYIHPKKTGISVNKNVGARVSKGDILIFCDSDIEVKKDTLKKVITAFKAHPKAAMIMGTAIWKGGEKDGQKDRPRREDRILKYQGTNFVEAIYGRFMATYKDIFWQVGGFDEEFFNMRGEGSNFSIRYWRSGFPLVYEPLIETHHVFGAADAITRSISYPERGPLRDWLILSLQYGLWGREGNFAKTMSWLEEWFGKNDKYVIMENVVALLPWFVENWKRINKASKKALKPKYDFKFLEIFSERKLFEKCVREFEK
ncbi:glycosyltransferase [Candidatus Microgenomates bacterium]|nr:glycosyltransferase [Candidatus Microgenomates bacterium]